MLLMIHTQSTMRSIKELSSDIELDDTDLHILIIDPLPFKFLTALIWGQLGRDCVDFVVEYTCNWVNSITVPLIEYTQHGCKVMVYYSSATEARDKVKVSIQSILREAGVSGDIVVLTGLDGLLMTFWLVDLFPGKTSSENYKVAVVYLVPRCTTFL